VTYGQATGRGHAGTGERWAMLALMFWLFGRRAGLKLAAVVVLLALTG
jgi:hypothetical protein